MTGKCSPYNLSSCWFAVGQSGLTIAFVQRSCNGWASSWIFSIPIIFMSLIFLSQPSIWVEIYDHEVDYYQFKRLCKAFVSSFHCFLATNYQFRNWLHSSTTFIYFLYFTIILNYSMGCWSPGRITSSLSVSFMASKAYHLSHWSNSL